MHAERFYIFFLVALLLAGIGACKKGCTDVHAINYSNSAKEEDGSCMFCDSSLTDYGAQSDAFYDNQYPSPHYNEEVISMTVLIKQQIFTGNACKFLGHGTDNACNRYAFYPTLTNLTNSTVTVEFTFSMTEFQTGMYFQKYINVIIAPYSQVNLGNIGGLCIPESIIFTSFNVNSTTPIFTYR